MFCYLCPLDGSLVSIPVLVNSENATEKFFEFSVTAMREKMQPKTSSNKTIFWCIDEFELNAMSNPYWLQTIDGTLSVLRKFIEELAQTSANNFKDLAAIVDRTYAGIGILILGWQNLSTLSSIVPVLPFAAGLLSDRMILKNLYEGNIVIDPFIKEHLTTTAYDVRLGPYYYKPAKLLDYPYDPYDPKQVKAMWGSPLYAANGFIIIEALQTLLCHTIEMIGGKNGVTTQMHARSSIGRNFLTTNKCAGWGDVGFVSKWTMEITNTHPTTSIMLRVGERVAQISFVQTSGTIGNREYAGSYMSRKTMWQPSDMLPKLTPDIKQEPPQTSILTPPPNLGKQPPQPRKRT